MKPLVKNSLIGCGGLIGLLCVLILILFAFSGPGKVPPHEFDLYRLDHDACMRAFDGRLDSEYSHIWVLRSPNLKAWWAPNGLRAEAELILDTDDVSIVRDLMSRTSISGEFTSHVRTLSEGRIYHVLLFSKSRKTYAHLRFSYRSKQADGSTAFKLVTTYDGASPVKDCLGFTEFERTYLHSTLTK